MKMTRLMKVALGTGVAALILAFAPATSAFASPAINVPCSGVGGGTAGLIAAINTANGGGGGTINLAPGCPYMLSSLYSPVHGGNGLPMVVTPITVNGFGATIARVSVANFRIFEVDGPGGSLTVQGLTITGGASAMGGGIFNDEGTVTLNHSRVTGNNGGMGGGGIASGIGPDHMGDIGPKGTLTLNFSQVYGNTTGGGGGGILNHGGTLTLNFSQVNGNTSTGGGGGIASGPGGGGTSTSVLTLNFSSVNNNTSTGGQFDGAGGIANGGTATINVSQVNNNTAPGAPGGGILNHGGMTINLSDVSYNTAPNDGTTDGIGGGIANLNFSDPTSGVLSVNLSHVNNNSASGFGGGILEAGEDNSFMPTLPGNPLNLKLTLVTGNHAADGGGIYTIAGSPVTLKSSFVAKNTPDNCVPTGSISGCIG
jgi:hypothetical protein